jgi:quinol monooxygenase YgiN
MTTPSTEIVIIASARALPGKEPALERALRDVAAPTLSQAGCLGFQLYRSEDGSTITAVERWASKGEHERHLQGAHVQKLMAAMAGVVAGPPQIASYRTLDQQ